MKLPKPITLVIEDEELAALLWHFLNCPTVFPKHCQLSEGELHAIADRVHNDSDQGQRAWETINEVRDFEVYKLPPI